MKKITHLKNSKHTYFKKKMKITYIKIEKKNGTLHSRCRGVVNIKHLIRYLLQKFWI